MNWQAFFKGDYISAEEMGGKVPTLTITGVKGAVVEDETGKQKGKALVSFKEIDRPWMLCKTNAICLAAMFGNEVEGWAGKRVTIYSTEVRVGKEKALGIRIKGSPDLTATVDAVVKLPRRKPITMRMQPTGVKANGSARPQKTQEPNEEAPPEPSAAEPEPESPEERIDF